MSSSQVRRLALPRFLPLCGDLGFFSVFARLHSLRSLALSAFTGALVYGYVRSVQAYGCVVMFAGGLAGLAHKSQLADAYVADPHDHYTEGQSVRASVLEVDPGAAT